MLTLAVLIGLCYIFLFTHIPESLTYFVKILPMLLIIAYTLRLQLTRTPYHRWLIVGLTFCMIGDYTLQWFIVGLSFFLTGHIFYIVAFMRTKQQRAPLAIKLAVTLYAGLMIWWDCRYSTRHRRYRFSARCECLYYRHCDDGYYLFSHRLTTCD